MSVGQRQSTPRQIGTLQDYHWLARRKQALRRKQRQQAVAVHSCALHSYAFTTTAFTFPTFAMALRVSMMRDDLLPNSAYLIELCAVQMTTAS